jgi:hypothetical protein
VAEIPFIDPATVSPADQLASAKRELNMRRNAYPRWVDDGRYTAAHAAREIAAMAAIVATLERLEAQERLL